VLFRRTASAVKREEREAALAPTRGPVIATRRTFGHGGLQEKRKGEGSEEFSQISPGEKKRRERKSKDEKAGEQE